MVQQTRSAQKVIQAVTRQAFSAGHHLYHSPCKPFRRGDQKWDNQMQIVAGLSKGMQRRVDPIPRLPQDCKNWSETTSAIVAKKSRSKEKGPDNTREWLVEPIKVLASKMLGKGRTPELHIQEVQTGSHQTLCKQASLQKPGKSCKMENLRPKSVQTVCWRLFGSAVIQSSSSRNWRENTGVGHLVAHREAAEQIAAQGSAGWRNLDAGFPEAMDFSKPFEHMNPSLSVKVWSRQVRSVTHDRHKDRASLRWAVAHSQGGPMCQWCVGCGSWEAPNDSDSVSNEETRTGPSRSSRRSVATEQTQKHERCQHGRGMDGRTAIRSIGTDLVQTCGEWKRWSDMTRLKENWAKLHLKQEEIRNACAEQSVVEWQQQVCDEARKHKHRLSQLALLCNSAVAYGRIHERTHGLLGGEGVSRKKNWTQRSSKVPQMVGGRTEHTPAWCYQMLFGDRAGDACVARITAGAGAICSITGAGAAEVTAGAGASYSTTDACVVWFTAGAGATHSVTGVGAARVTAGAAMTFSWRELVRT